LSTRRHEMRRDGEVNPYKSPASIGSSSRKTWRASKLATAVKLAGIVLFGLSMPLDVLGGHGRGFVADYDNFQGYEVVALFGVSMPLSGIVGMLPVSITVVWTFVAPFVNFGRMAKPQSLSWVIFGCGASLVALVLLGNWDAG